MSFQDDIFSIPNENFKNNYVLVFDLGSMQHAIEYYHYSELVGEPLRLELDFICPLEHVTELIGLGERISSVAVDKFAVVEKKLKMESNSLQRIINRILLLNYRYRCPFPSECVPDLRSPQWDFRSYKKATQQNAGWALDIECKHSSQIVFCRLSWKPNVQFPQAAVLPMMPDLLLSYTSFCSFYKILASFHLLKLRQEEILAFTTLFYFHF